MRGVVAKRLRREAEAASVGAPRRVYMQVSRMGFWLLINHPNTTRAKYRALKHARHRKEAAAL
jgi:hypothetical protein